MKGFILAAGFGERLRPLTDRIPKPLVPVNGIPAIVYSIALLKSCGIDEVICNLHYRTDDVIKFFRSQNNFGMKVHFSVENEILGTGGGIRKCRDILNDDFILINSDIVSDVDLQKVVKKYNESGRKSCIVVVPKESEGTVSLDDKNVADFRNFLKSGIRATHEYTGIAILNQEIMEYLIPDFSSVVYTGFTSLIVNNRLIFHEHRGMWQDIGTPENLDQASEKAGNDEQFIKMIIETSGYKGPDITSS